MSKFSVIVPVYNVAAYLREALNSVLHQTCGDWECVCVNDGSTDGSREILDEYAMCDTRFRVFHQKNSGVAAARNKALSEITGEWICFLDGDDAIHPQLFEKMKKFIAVDDEADIISFNHKLGVEVKFTLKDSSDVAETSKLDLRDFISTQIANKGMWENIYRRCRGADIRFKPYPIGEDKLYLAEWICRSRKVVLTNIEGYWYRTRTGSAINSALTIKKIRSNYETGKTMLQLYSAKFPKIDKRIIRGECVRIAEYTANDLVRISASEEKKKFIREWCEDLGNLANCLHISRWFRFVCSMVGQCHFLWHVLLVLPFKMKLVRNRVLHFLHHS